MRSAISKSHPAFYLLAGCLLVSTPAFSQAHQTQPVLVVNGSAAPVPTAAQGTTNVAGTVSLASGSTVNIGNTPSVTVANTPSVNVSNTPTVNLAVGAAATVTNPLDGQSNPTPLITLEASQPYEDSCIAVVNQYGYGQCSFQTVPAGKRLVIEEFDALGELPSGSKPIYINVITNGATKHNFTATFMGSGFSYDVFVTHQETRLYQAQNTAPMCFAGITNPSNSPTYTCNLSGFLVDVP